MRIALFPLGTVLFPGVPLPLHIFEERYRLLVRSLVDQPADEPRRFGVVAIRQGHEVGADGARALHQVGCTAELRQVEAYDDGRFDVMTTGGARFVVREVDHSLPYLQAEVELLAEPAGAPGDGVAVVQEMFTRYLGLLGAARGVPIDPPDLPDDALLLSYLVAATMLLDVADKQQLLEAPDAAARLRAEAAVLARESRLVRLLSAVPSPDLLRGRLTPN